MKHILILGAGLVAGPIIRHLLEKNYAVTVASNTPARAAELINRHPNGRFTDWSVEDQDTLREMISEHDIAVSLLPYAYHTMVAEHCISEGKNMVTTSYVKPEMQSLDSFARQAGILILNEIGLDPGIDHMSAMRIIDHIHSRGGSVEEFYSICGALPAPEAADNPFRYKFSWSPHGVLLAGNNDGRYLKNGSIVEVPTEKLFRHIYTEDFPGVGMLEVYPNRNSTDYIEIYGIPEVRTIMRGTFRYPGWCESLDIMKQLGLLTHDAYETKGHTYKSFLALINNIDLGLLDLMFSPDIQNPASPLQIQPSPIASEAIRWLGWLSQEALPEGMKSPFEVTEHLMLEKMTLKSRERDMVVMQHTFLATFPDGSKERTYSRMLDFGVPGADTAIARTVTLPAAVAVEMILQGKIAIKGVHRPVIPEIYNPVLDALEDLGISMEDVISIM